MDPVALTLVIKALDAAFVIGNYMIRRAEAEQHKETMEDALGMIHAIRLQLADGNITPEQASEDLDQVLDQTLGPLREAMGRL